ncbi:hypothetical protein CEE37_12350 [candidate division LCP-89 bacterium B3_LCP]|uniref:Uncharacterized protein n=1 Tax=candidate division LCP-89 bacterium B3_LCP TaxID=2012998 RepID=A0A532UUC9_UNCL8|nr:MAG: hypothetical protein CEE37_12350 [candidate division LCP-89 bacterium B3_LCP]
MPMLTYMTNSALVRANFQCECKEQDHDHKGRCQCKLFLDAYRRDDPLNKEINEDTEHIILCKPCYTKMRLKKERLTDELNHLP